MKFAKELEENLVAEWKEKYLDYKGGKKKLKKVAEAVRRADRSPSQAWPRSATPVPSSGSYRDGPVQSFLRGSAREAPAYSDNTYGTTAPTKTRSDTVSSRKSQNGDLAPPTTTKPIQINERSPLQPKGNASQDQGPGLTRYGSIIGSPHMNDGPPMEHLDKQASLLELPDPALDPSRPKGRPSLESESDHPHPHPHPTVSSAPAESHKSRPSTAHPTIGGNSHDLLKPHESTPKATKSPGHRSLFSPKRANTTFSGTRPFMKRMFSVTGSPNQTRHTQEDVALEAYSEADFRQEEFFQYLDKQLSKIEKFYKSKEDEAIDRLKMLREQLHVMRNRRLEEVLHADQHKQKASSHDSLPGGDSGNKRDHASTQNNGHYKQGYLSHMPWMAPVSHTVDHIDHAIDKVRPGRVGKTSRKMGSLGTPEFPPNRGPADQRDYTRRQASNDVPYRVAKRKLKVAMAEYYRGLELLKSYALLNRTAFRKINKKYDKTVNAHPPGRFMSEKVNKAYFVNSDLLDSLIHDVEDLYARYFERGNHKVAVGKLRAKTAKAGDFTGSIWRQGVLATAGAVFGIQGLVYGIQQIFNDDPVVGTESGYLLQIYGGYFLMLLLVGLFVLDARAFAQAKVNYQFVFEFDSRHMLDWRQLSEMPALFLFFLGLIMWLNFQNFGGHAMYLYWPVILIGIAVGALFFPGPYFYQKSRFWLLYSNWRLLLAGIYPVEFRDFFLGDMFCSLTYAMGHIELFFCLYARHWNQPAICNSSHSRLLGFFTTLPGIWRALQCIRRFYDTRNVFPHLVNCGKYCFTILAGMSLSLYRISGTTEMMAFFILCASINSIYCSIWDVIMDWSLGVPSAKYRFLRHKLAYKQIWWYYAAMIIDPILRCNWIFYIIFRTNVQQSSVVAFFIAFSEVIRRGIWTLFRVENEHCNNVGRFRASRDVPLPYDLEHESTKSLLDKTSGEDSTQRTNTGDTEQTLPQSGHTQATQNLPTEQLTRESTRTSATDIEQGLADRSPSSLRRRHPSLTNSPIARAFRQAGNTMRSAHAQDYERKRKPELEAQDARADDEDEDDDDDDDDDDDEAEGSSDSDSNVRRQRTKSQKDRSGSAVERRSPSEEGGRQDIQEAEDLFSRGSQR